ncbi:MAG: VCBS repeat-containing protein [Opitutaceae bacterium]|mgnify:CR=1 FL=1|jgi:hypothetical protein|nr:VCBS repeat-containing protein [Opitutaceae bacterium]
MAFLRPIPKFSGAIVLIVLGLGMTGCGKPPTRGEAITQTLPNSGPVEAGDLFESKELGTFTDLPPWIAHLKVIDLDQDGLDDIVFCEAQDNEVRWIRQTARGEFVPERLLAADMSGPVHVEGADMDADGDIDLIVSSMTIIFPHNDRIGHAFILENDGAENFTTHSILQNTSRIVDMRPADLNGDGRLDLAVAQFGYDQGQVAWLEHVGPSPWDFKRHVLLELSGAINVEVADFNGDRIPDIAALMSQQWEEVYTFLGTGHGNFTTQRIWGSTNEDYGSSGMSVADLNRDGRPDLICSNGDGFGPAATPGPRPWHGLQWFENTGNGGFKYHRIGALPGAYAPIGVDLDQDGAMDVVSAAAYADWNNQNREVVSLMWFRNDGQMNFTPHVLSREPKDLITLGVGTFDHSGKPALISGGFYIYPPFDSMGRIMLWHR